MSGHHNSKSEHLNKPRPRSTRNYTSTGRPFTKADLTPRPLQNTNEDFNDSCSWYTANNATQDSMCPKEYMAEGRPFNPSLDISGNRSGKSQCPKGFSREGRSFNPALDITANRLRQQDSERGSRFNLEYEMAKNKENALGRLRAEEANGKAITTRLPINYENKANKCCRAPMPSCSRGRQFDMRSELQRQQQQLSPNICAQQRCVYINQGRSLDVDRIYDYDLQACSPVGASGRPLDLQRDLTFRRKNLPTPKQQRASSCPTPLQYSTFQTPVQRVPRICPRTSQSVRTSPTRSNSPSELSKQHLLNTATASPAHTDEYSKTPVCRPTRTPESQEIETSKHSPVAATKTITTTPTGINKPSDFSQQSFGDQTFRRGVEATPQSTIFMSPQGPGESSPQLKAHQTPKRRIQDTSHITGETSREMDAVYRQSPQKSFTIRTPIRTPEQPPNITDPSTQRSLQMPYDSVGPHSPGANKMQIGSIPQDRSMSTKNRTIHNITQTMPTPSPLAPTESHNMSYRDLSRNYRPTDPCYINQTFDNEDDYTPVASRTFSSSRQPRTPQRQQVVTPESNYCNQSMINEPSKYKQRIAEIPVDLTNDTIYQCDMDISEPEFTTRAYPVRQEESMLTHSWTIPPEDITCQECPRDGTFSPRQPDFSSTHVTPINKTFVPDYNSTVYRELPRELSHSPATTCPPCEKPKASLFRCLADKLSSTYDFLSSFVSADKTAGVKTLPTEDRTMGHSFATKSCPYDTKTFDLRNLYASQQPETSTLGLNTFFETKLQLMDTSPSIRECANAKRCGRVQFDSMDKSQAQDPQRSLIRKAEIENLVKDTYCPGIIQETIDGRENFNDYSFNMSLSYGANHVTLCERPPKEDHMTLLEAFSMRIERERTEINKDLSGEATEEQIEDSIHKYFANQNPSDLNRSIKSLLLSEHLQEHEQVQESKGLSLEAEVQKLITTFPENAKVKLICYTGHTRPTKDKSG